MLCITLMITSLRKCSHFYICKSTSDRMANVLGWFGLILRLHTRIWKIKILVLVVKCVIIQDYQNDKPHVVFFYCKVFHYPFGHVMYEEYICSCKKWKFSLNVHVSHLGRRTMFVPIQVLAHKNVTLCGPSFWVGILYRNNHCWWNIYLSDNNGKAFFFVY